MKKKIISEIISLTDDRFIEEAASVTKKNRRIFRYAGIAACLAAAVTSAVLISQSDFVKPVPEIITEAASNTSGGGDKTVQEIETAPAIDTDALSGNESGGEIEMAVIPKWNNLATPEKYREVIFEDITYSTRCCEISDDNVLDFLGDAEMQGYDVYTDKTYTVNAKIYSVKSISRDCAVAVKIGDDDRYYAFVNVWYEPETLGDFINDLDLKNTVSFGKAYVDIYKYDTLSTSHSEIIYADFDDNVIWDMLSDVLDAKNVEYNQPCDRIDIETNLPLLGYKNISFCITSDGYIITNILGTQKCFFAGTAKYVRFDNHLKESVPFKQIDNIYHNSPDTAVPGKGDAGQTTPGYNPGATATTPPYSPGEEVTSPPYFPDEIASSPTYNPDGTISTPAYLPGTQHSAPSDKPDEPVSSPSLNTNEAVTAPAFTPQWDLPVDSPDTESSPDSPDLVVEAFTTIN